MEWRRNRKTSSEDDEAMTARLCEDGICMYDTCIVSPATFTVTAAIARAAIANCRYYENLPNLWPGMLTRTEG